MEEKEAADNRQERPWSPRSRRGRQFLKAVGVLLVAFVLFAAGLAIGRGDVSVGFLSQKRPLGVGTAFDYSSVEELYQLLASDFDGSLDKSQLLDGLKSGLISATGDPYTQYFNPQEARDFNQALSGSFTGIGAELGTDEDNNIVVVAPLSGYPAEMAGLKPKDIIAAVDGQITSDMRLDAVVRKIRGPADTDVTLTIIRGRDKPFDVTITRQPIKVSSVKYQVDGQIGYLKISQFSDDTNEQVKKAAAEFKAKDVKGVVLDLRSNPGGYLDVAVDIAGMWLEKGKVIVSERRGSTTLSTKHSRGTGEFKGWPTAVLTNDGSASAAEIVAGALRDNHAATLVGSKTFGKGSVQKVIKLADDSELKVTVAHWYTPAGKNIDKQGITPDVAVIISEAEEQADQDPQKAKAYELLKTQLR